MKMNIKRIATLASAAVLAFVFFSNFGFIKSIGSSIAYERPSEKKSRGKNALSSQLGDNRRDGQGKQGRL
jgi:hypothetical protein